MSILSMLGALIIVVGVALFIGNVSRVFPTFPLAGWATIALGGMIFRAGKAS